jgi:Asp-tRNA(Asn)/Glu-tRNA(Gln) amidotransferase A subunit family amidase
MTSSISPLSEAKGSIERRELDPLTAAAAALAHSNNNAGANVYLSIDRDWTLSEAVALPARFPNPSTRPPLYGLPISLKDCFDLEGFRTSCGSRFYAEHNGLAATDSWVAAKLRAQGAIITGKTHLHQLAYGITGENADYGDCLQPRDATRLTGGSSSGAAASVQEGSAIAAIGTDTGGSIRVPAALCGLAGYRSSVGLGDWRGAAHLAASFDTIGWLFRDIADAQQLAYALLDVPIKTQAAEQPIRIGAVTGDFLHDCESEVLRAYDQFQNKLKHSGVSIENFDTRAWNDSFEIFAPLQASEAAALHAGYFSHFETAIAERLAWGTSISAEELRMLRQRLEDFRLNFGQLFDRYDFLILPCAPVTSLTAGADHSNARQQILRYTTPASLAGAPVVAIPIAGAGVQLIGRHAADAKLLAFVSYLAQQPPSNT